MAFSRSISTELVEDGFTRFFESKDAMGLYIRVEKIFRESRPLRTYFI